MNRLAIALVLAAGSTALAQNQPPAQPANDALAGPTVQETKAKPTLIKRDFNGLLVRPDLAIEEAALDLLDLTDEERAATGKVLDERAAILDSVVGNNLDLLIQFNGAADRNPQSIKAVRDFATKLEPLRARGRLIDELAQALPADKAQDLRDLHKEYWQAIIKEESDNARKAGEQGRPREILATETLKAFGAEIRRSYERRVVSGTRELDELLARLGLSPETEGQVRKITQDWFQETLGRPTEAQRRQLTTRIFAVLKPDERARVLREIYSDRGGASRKQADSDGADPMSPASGG